MKNYPHDEVLIINCQSTLEQDWVPSCSNGANLLVGAMNPGNMCVYREICTQIKPRTQHFLTSIFFKRIVVQED